MSEYRIVVDTNVFITALRSRRGASHRLLLLIDSERFALNVSVPLILEYEAVAKRSLDELSLPEEVIDDILDYICAVSNHTKVFYLWRPFLRDPKDDMVLELAVAANCDFIITYNKKDFEGVEQFGVDLLTPKEFLQEIGELP